MLAYGINWPSVAEDSEVLRKHIARAQRLALLRANLAAILADLRRAA